MHIIQTLQYHVPSMKSEEEYPVALWVERQKGTDMISRVYKIHRTSVAMSYKW